jgi:predicted PurR-regulated permease PerM
VLSKITARHLRILLWLALILLVGVVIWVSWTVLLPFFLGLVLAYLLLPLVN